MAKIEVNDFAKYLTTFLSKYLPGQRNVSTNTIMSYRDTFKLFLKFCNTVKNLKTEHITIQVITKALVIEFLDWIEACRECSVSTRNQRLAAIHAFFRYVQQENPENLLEIQKILTISIKKTPKPVISYLTADKLEILFKQPDMSMPEGRRDLVMMVVLYDTAARVQELIDLTVRDIRLSSPPVMTLKGKGGKSRQVPIMGKTYDLLKDYLEEFCHHFTPDQPVFYNHQKKKLSRWGISYIINKYIGMARNHTGFRSEYTITPHVFRHSKAMGLLQAGVNIIYIRDFLGHVNVNTTQIYARADSEIKRKALESAYINLTPNEIPLWNEDQNLMNWLQNLCK
jgi:integrase/recombinase XerD